MLLMWLALVVYLAVVYASNAHGVTPVIFRLNRCICYIVKERWASHVPARLP